MQQSCLCSYSRDCRIYPTGDKYIVRIMNIKVKKNIKKCMSLSTVFTLELGVSPNSKLLYWKQQAFVVRQSSFGRVQAKWRLTWNRFGSAGFLRDKTHDSL